VIDSTSSHSPRGRRSCADEPGDSSLDAQGAEERFGGNGAPLRHAFTVDVEDYFQVSALDKHIPRSQWDGYESRVVGNTQRILRLLEARGVRATFFILGWVAERYGDLVREIHRAGHEVASHGYWHYLVYSQTPDEFRADVRQSRETLENLIGEPVTAYRAPSFSITRRSLWALEILIEEGYQVDSSIVPARHDRYGIPSARADIHRLSTPAGTLWEFPPTVVRLAGANVPVGGGGYFRLYPLSWTCRCLSRLEEARRQPFMFYIHPWEIDPDQPRLRFGSRVARWRHTVNLARTEAKLAALLERFPFGRMCDALALAPIEEPVPAEQLRGRLAVSHA